MPTYNHGWTWVLLHGKLLLLLLMHGKLLLLLMHGKLLLLQSKPWIYYEDKKNPKTNWPSRHFQKPSLLVKTAKLV